METLELAMALARVRVGNRIEFGSSVEHTKRSHVGIYVCNVLWALPNLTPKAEACDFGGEEV